MPKSHHVSSYNPDYFTIIRAVVEFKKKVTLELPHGEATAFRQDFHAFRVALRFEAHPDARRSDQILVQIKPATGEADVPVKLIFCRKKDTLAGEALASVLNSLELPEEQIKEITEDQDSSAVETTLNKMYNLEDEEDGND